MTTVTGRPRAEHLVEPRPMLVARGQLRAHDTGLAWPPLFGVVLAAGVES